MIDFELTEEQKQLKALVKEFCEREVDFKELQRLADQAGLARTVEEIRANFPWGLLRKLHEVGLRQFCIPEKYGGGGYGTCSSVTRAIVAEELGYYMGVGSRILTVPWFGHCSQSAHTEEQSDWFFTRYMENPNMTVSASTSEPSGQIDVALPYEEIGEGYPRKVSAYRDGDEWVINGDKMFSSNGCVADLHSCSCRIDKTAPLALSSTNFWVPKDSPGITYTVNRLLMGEIGGNCQISYDNVRVPDSHRSGPLPGESRPTEETRGITAMAAKTLIFIDWLGHIRRVYEQIVDYAKERMGGGVPIIQHSSIAALLGDVALHLDATRALVYRVSWENDQLEKAGKPTISYESNGVNVWVRKTSLLCCEVGHEVYAGLGGSVDLDLEGLVRRTFTWPQGNKTIHKIKYSMLNNNHIMACQAPQIAKLKELGREELFSVPWA